jgi:dynein assembly factor 3
VVNGGRRLLLCPLSPAASMSLEGAGAVRFWGFSPAVDLIKEAPPDASASELLRILMIAPADVRHVLKTVAAEHERAASGGVPARQVEFAVFEKEPEVLARHMLLLAIAVDFELPRRERAEILLEVWANTMLRERTAAYVAARGEALSRVLTDGEGPLAQLIDYSALKGRDLDALDKVRARLSRKAGLNSRLRPDTPPSPCGRSSARGARTWTSMR